MEMEGSENVEYVGSGGSVESGQTWTGDDSDWFISVKYMQL